MRLRGEWEENMKHAIAAATAVLLATTVMPASSAEVELRLAHWLPPTHPVQPMGMDPWIESIKQASNGRINITVYPASQLGAAPDHFDMARDGIAEITYTNPGYQAGRFPIFAATELPLLISNGAGGSQAVDAWYRKYAPTEMKDVRFCLAHLHLGAIHGRKPIRAPEDFKGMRVRSSSGTVAQAMTQLEATNVQVPAVEARDALDKGIADALTFPWTSLVSSLRRSSVRAGSTQRITLPSFEGFTPRSLSRSAFSIAVIADLSKGETSTVRASVTWKDASCWSGVGAP